MAQLRDLIVTGAARFVNGAYFGGASTFGSATRPVWWNNGFPQATTYSLSATLNAGSANRLAYYSGANAVSASSHYASATQVGINITNVDTIGSRALYVNGTSQFSDDIYANKSIRNLAVGGGLYWNPYVESATDNSDAASITLIKSGIAGGTELQIKQANDQNDVINLVTPYYIYLNNKRAFTVNDSWLRINDTSTFTSGIYTGTSILRTDNQLQVGNNGANFYVKNTGDAFIQKTLGIGGTDIGYTLYVKGKTRFDNLLHFEDGTGYTELTTESRRSKNSSNADIETITGLVTKKTSFIEIRGFAPTTMVRTTGDRPAPYGIGFGDGSDSAGIMPIGSQDKLTELMFYGANSGPTLFTWKHQIWEDKNYDADNSNGYSAAMMSLNSKTGDLYVKNTIGINGTNTTYKLYVNGTSYFTDTINFPAHNSKQLQFIKWTSAADNNTTGRSWYGIGTYANANDSNQVWLNFSNYFGIDITTRGNIYLRHNNKVIPNTNNATGNVGGDNNPVFIAGGVITPSSSTTGSNSCPVYLNKGVITPCATNLTDYIRKDGDNYYVRLTDGSGNNTAGYRLLGSITLGTWSNYRQVWAVTGRHGGSGIITVAFGNNTADTATSTNSYCQIKYFGNTGCGSVVSSDSFMAYMNGSTLYLFWKYYDYCNTDITILRTTSPGFRPSNGTWMTSIDAATYGTRIALTEINAADTAVALTSSAGNTGQPVYFSGGKPVAIDWHIGNSGVGEHNCNNVTYNFCGYYTSNGPATSLGASTDGALYAQAYNSTWVGQIAQDYRNGGLYVRGKNNGTWQSWYKVLDTRNYSGVLDGRYVLKTGTAPTNLNSATTSGFYRVNSGHSNSPADWGQLIVCHGGGDTITQIYGDYASGTLYTRSGNPSDVGGSGAWRGWYRLWKQGDAVTGAVWNDYAECRQAETEEAGYVLYETGKDDLKKTTERLQHFAGVSSDTWGFSQGETEKAKTPIAVAGRVLVYPHQDRNNYQPGDCVCAAPGGTVDIMTREEVVQYPDRIVGTVSCVPDYEEWGGGEGADRTPVKVNGRIWIKVK